MLCDVWMSKCRRPYFYDLTLIQIDVMVTTLSKVVVIMGEVVIITWMLGTTATTVMP